MISVLSIELFKKCGQSVVSVTGGEDPLVMVLWTRSNSSFKKLFTSLNLFILSACFADAL